MLVHQGMQIRQILTYFLMQNKEIKFVNITIDLKKILGDHQCALQIFFKFWIFSLNLKIYNKQKILLLYCFPRWNKLTSFLFEETLLSIYIWLTIINLFFPVKQCLMKEESNFNNCGNASLWEKKSLIGVHQICLAQTSYLITQNIKVICIQGLKFHKRKTC